MPTEETSTTSSGQRVYDTLRKFRKAQSDRSVRDTWIEVLQIQEEVDYDELADAAARALRSQLRIVQARLRELAAPESLYEEAITFALRMFRGESLPAAVKDFHGQALSDKSLMAFQWASWTLTTYDEEDIPDTASLKALEDSIAEQEALLRSAVLPREIREMIIGHVEALKDALRLRAIHGYRPLSDAVKAAYGDLSSASPDLVKTAQDAPREAQSAIGKFVKLVGESAKFADSASKTAKFAKEVYGLATEHGPKAIAWADDFMKSLPALPTPPLA